MPNFADRFDGSSLDAVKWSDESEADVGSSASAVVSGGRLILTADAGTGAGAEAGIVAVNSLNFSARGVWGIELVSTSDPVDAEFVLRLTGGSVSERIRWYVVGGDLIANYRNGGADDDFATAAYDATAHRWLRWRWDAANTDIVWETSPNGTQWTEFGRHDSEWAVTSLTLSMALATEIASAKVATLDNAGPLPPHQLGLTGVGG